MSWQIRKSKADLSSSYHEIRERFSIPQEVRLAYDRCHEETDGILSQIIKAMTPSKKDSSDLQSRTSSVSPKGLSSQQKQLRYKLSKMLNLKKQGYKLNSIAWRQKRPFDKHSLKQIGL